MANITEEHLHHMARRHHATMKKLDGMRERFAGYAQRGFSTLETGAGAWLGGALEGRTGGKSLGPVPLNLGAGLALIALGHINTAGAFIAKRTWTPGSVSESLMASASSGSDHLNNLGNGLVGSYLAAAGYSFGKKWKETGKVFGGGVRSWTHPYENGGGQPSGPSNGAPPPPASSGWHY